MIKKLITMLLSIILCLTFTLQLTSTRVLATNDEFDNPDDNIISQNEAETALLSEQPSDSPAVNGEAYSLFDASSGDFILGQNIDTPMEPASTTKVMTVLLALENLSMDDIITVTPSMYETIPDDYVKLGVVEGEEIAVRDLIYACLLISANDACLTLAVHMGGSEAEFCEMMNAKAVELGCTNTHFTTAYGFADPNNLTTAHDLALILREAVSHQDFSDISTTLQYTINPTNKYDDTRVITNANRFISSQQYSYDYYIGGKTGYTDTAGHTIVAASSKNGRILIGVILGSSDSATRYSNLISLFEYGYANYATIPIDETDFSGIFTDTISRFEELIVDYDLIVSEQSMSISPYITTTISRSSLGVTNSVELSGVLIDSNSTDQTFNIPLYRTYSDGSIYIVGSIHLRIVGKGKVIEITPEKKSIWTILKDVLITIIIAAALAAILILALLFFRKKNLKRKENEFRNKSKML